MVITLKRSNGWKILVMTNKKEILASNNDYLAQSAKFIVQVTPCHGQALSSFVLLHLLPTSSLADYVGQSVSGEWGESNHTYYTLKQPDNVSGYDEEKASFMFVLHHLWG